VAARFALLNARFARLPRAASIAATVMMAIGLLLAGIGWWLRPLASAERAAANGNTERAVEQYATGRHRLSLIPFVRDVVPGLSDLAIGNELSLQYALRRYDRILEEATDDTASAPALFWAGCVLFDKALVELDPKVRLETLSQASRRFRRALELDPGDWDTKYNYEVTDRLLGILQVQPQASPQEIIKLLRDRGPRPGSGRRIG
jgi:hypothetical protein